MVPLAPLGCHLQPGKVQPASRAISARVWAGWRSGGSAQVQDRAFGVREADRDVGLVGELPGGAAGDGGAVGVVAGAVLVEEVSQDMVSSRVVGVPPAAGRSSVRRAASRTAANAMGFFFFFLVPLRLGIAWSSRPSGGASAAVRPESWLRANDSGTATCCAERPPHRSCSTAPSSGYRCPDAAGPASHASPARSRHSQAATLSYPPTLPKPSRTAPRQSFHRHDVQARAPRARRSTRSCWQQSTTRRRCCGCGRGGRVAPLGAGGWHRRCKRLLVVRPFRRPLARPRACRCRARRGQRACPWHRWGGPPRRARCVREDGGGARCGIDRDYPAAHRELAARVCERGLIVSEYEPGIEPAPWRFPARNRIIAGLCAATIVVEARERSGRPDHGRLRPRGRPGGDGGSRGDHLGAVRRHERTAAARGNTCDVGCRRARGVRDRAGGRGRPRAGRAWRRPWRRGCARGRRASTSSPG